MRIVFIGSTHLGLRCLVTCLHIPALNVVGVATAPQTFVISYRPDGVTNVLHADRTENAHRHSILLRNLQNATNRPGLF